MTRRPDTPRSPSRRAFLARAGTLGLTGAALALTARRRGYAAEPLASAYDYVVIGAGSSGAAVAGLLSENPEVTVLLVEAGAAPDDPAFALPQAWPTLPETQPERIWAYATTPQPGLAGATRPMPRGKTLGGTSAINGMLFTRGHPADFDAWAEATGDDRWSWESLLPTFRAMEDYTGGGTPLRGLGGPLKVARPTAADRNPAAETFVAAMASAGHRLKAQANDPEVTGVSWSDFTIDTTGAAPRRCSSAVAFLEPARDRPNLTMATRTRTLGLTLERGRCTGARLLRDGRETAVRATRETILCAGALDTPRLLMLSGIGPAEALRRHGIAVAADLPMVGAEMQEHLMLESLVYATAKPVPPSAWNHVEALAFWRSGRWPGPQPDLFAGILTVPYAAPHAMAPADLPEQGVAVAPGVMRCHSRGRLTLASADPLAPARIDPNYLGDPRDLELLVEAVAHTRAAMADPVWEDWGLSEVLPGPATRTTEDLAAFARRAAGPFCHPAGTARMGRNPADSAVDAELRVHGIAGLRVADASVMPLLPSTPPNAACLMLGVRAAALVAETAA